MKLALEMRSVSKRYPGTLAVDQVSLEVQAGEVHALVGENGAGKSTLMKMLAGSFDDYTGEIAINGQVVSLHTPALAKKHGVGMIYQELSLAKPISIAENLLIGRLPTKFGFLDKAKLRSETKYWLEQVGLGLNPDLPVEDISPHEAQLVEIAKVLASNPSILVMDEPTSALSREEVERLFSIIDGLKKKGMAVVYISHHLPEIDRVADRVTVMRDGKKVATKAMSETSRQEIVQMMVGTLKEETHNTAARTPGKEILRIENLSRWGFFHGLNLVGHAGEIVGICGLAGAGRSELARVLVGLDKKDAGKMLIDGREVNITSMAQALRVGIAYLTEDRKAEGLALRMTVGENALVGIIPRHSTAGVYFAKRGHSLLGRLMNELVVSPNDPGRMVGNLSGGNQQKVLLAKWMASEPRVLILDEPTRGVDIGAKMLIHDSIKKLADGGHCILLISSDLPELVGLADRVMIMRKGRFSREMPRSQCTEESVLMAAYEGGV
ncbi:MAG: sugar ABC transporter ATP-binding protein [Spirochaetales bacterium]